MMPESQPSTTEPAPLRGIRVIDLSATLPGAQATQFLADCGAEVVLVEPPGGSRLRRSAGWPVLARGKRSIELDLRSEEGKAALDTLLRGADVLVATGRPDSLARRGLTAEALGEKYPRLVSAVITGWGTSGPWRDLPGYEGVVMAKLGMLHAKRAMAQRQGPAFVSVPYASWGAGQTAVHGVLSALLERETSGRGQHVEADLVRGVSMIDTWQWTAELIGTRWPGAYETVDAYTQDGEPRGHMLFPLLVAPTKDGQWLQFAQVEPRLFVAMLKEFGLGYMLTDPYWKDIPRFEDQKRRSELWEIMLLKVGERTLAEWQHAFDTNPDLSAELFRFGQATLDHPQLQHDGRVITVSDPVLGPVRQPSTLIQSDGGPLVPAALAPALDADHALLESAPPAGTAAAPAAPAGLPLAGVTILELGLMFAAPFGSTQLTDLGARVIKIESLKGDTIRNVLPFPESGGARVMQGKESICLDLNTDEGRAIVHELARRVDVVLQSFRAGAAKRAAVDADTLRALNPDLVYINAPGYGTDGPYGAKPAYAPSIGAAGGFALADVPGALAAGGSLEEIKQTSRQLNQAGAVPSLQADGVSALGVASSILVGLLGKARGRALGEITATMLGTAGHALVEAVTDYADRPATPIVDPGLHGTEALYRLYQASDGWVFLSVRTDAEWAALVAELDVPALAESRFAGAEARRAHDDELIAVLAEVFAGSPAAEWERRLLAAGAPCVQVTETVPEAYVQNDPALLAEYAVDAVSPIFGEYQRQGPPIRFSRSTTVARGGCLAGDQTDEILTELGYPADRIAELRDRGIVA
ncbi:MAG TPA: CoA transferase [Amycolatopsis sp.]|nr:CoA transferase [Amycolatopsis sp.]